MNQKESLLRNLNKSLQKAGKKTYSIEVLNASASEYRKKIYGMLLENNHILTFETLLSVTDRVAKHDYIDGVLCAGRFLLGNKLIEECYIFLTMCQEKVAEVYGEPIDYSLFEEIGNMFYLSGLCETAIQWYFKLMDMNEAPESRMYFNIAMCYQVMENYKAAIEHYEKSTNADPKFFKSWINLGYCYTKTKLPDKAIQAYQQLPLSGENLLCMGNALFYNNRYEEALAYYLRSVELKEDPGAYNNLGVVLKKLKLFQDSICAFADSLSLRPNTEAATNLLSLYIELGKKHEALTLYANCKHLFDIVESKKFQSLIETTFPSRPTRLTTAKNLTLFSGLLRRNTVVKPITGNK